MALVDRVKNITLAPAAEWPVIAAEPTNVSGLFTGYVIPLAAIGPVCAFVSQALFLHHAVIGIAAAVLAFALEIVGVFVLGAIADALAPSFDGVKNGTQAMKWVAYSNTPRWIAGVANLIPILGSIIVLLASLYGLYVLYLGAIPVMAIPKDKAIGYTVVVVICDIVFAVIVGVLVGILITAMAVGAGVAGGLRH